MVCSLFSWLLNAVEVVYLAVAIRVYRFIDYVQTIFRYYPHALFRRADRLLLGAYLFDNPYTLSRRFLQQRKAKDVYAYGETPLQTIDWIAKRCQITASDTVFELGAGRGRTCFWLRSLIGCRVVGIEYVPVFVSKARAVANRLKIDRLEFRCEDYLNTDFSGATVIYLYASNLDDAVISKLIQRFARLPKGTRFITVSFPLSDYTSEPLFDLLDRFPAFFLWGTTTVFLEVKKE